MVNTFPPEFKGNKVSPEETLSAKSAEVTTTQPQIKQKPDSNQQSPKQEGIAIKTIVKILAISIIPLSVLAAGIKTYYDENKLSKQIDAAQQVEWKQPKLLIPLLLIGAGTVSSALAALSVNSILSSAKTEKKEATREELTKRFRILSSAIDKIRAGTNPEDILKTTVSEARSAIAADRVLVYSLDEKSQGKVIAESVAPRYPRALNAIIEDPCFNALYLEKYQNGRVQATDDIYQANLTPCHLSQLEPFAVKANLVTPILNQGKLLGLLIAHHCAAPHAWGESEIDVMVQIAKQVGLVLDNINLINNSVRLQKEKETEINRIKSLANATKKIRASFTEEAVFKIAVEEARSAIAADRVVVYSLDELSQGKVIAESLNPHYPKSLGKIIDDPCFSSFYIGKYQNGRVKAINDIYQTNLTACHLDQLESFEVKANLVTPIIHQGKLIGLLIAHYCAAPHVWQQSEIDVIMQIANQTGLALDYIKQLTTSTNLQQQKEIETKRIKSLTNAVARIRKSLKPEDIFQTGVEEARSAIAADRVVVYSLDELSQGKVIAESLNPRYPKSLGKIIDDPCFSSFYINKYQNGRVKAIDDIYQTNLNACHLDQLESFEVKANLVTPILKQGKLIGLLIAHYCAAPHVWQQSEIDVIMQIAKQIGFAIDNYYLLKEVAQVSQAFMEQIPAVADFAQVTIANAQQAQIQVQQTSQTIKAGREVANQTVYDLADIQENIAQTVSKIRYLGQSSQKISQLVAVIDNLATQINIQGMNMLIRASKTGNPADGSRTAPLAQTMESLREELAEATLEIQSFVKKIETEVDDLSMTMKAKTEKVVKGADLVEETWQKLNQIDTVTDKMSVLLGNIINAAAKGVQTSAGTSQAVLKNSNFLPQNPSQPRVVSDSLNKLVETYLEVENSLIPQENNPQNFEDKLLDSD